MDERTDSLDKVSSSEETTEFRNLKDNLSDNVQVEQINSQLSKETAILRTFDMQHSLESSPFENLQKENLEEVDMDSLADRFEVNKLTYTNIENKSHKKITQKCKTNKSTDKL